MQQAVALAAASFIWLASGVSPAHYWLDSGEISAAATELAVMHPTGVPGLMPLLHLALFVPVGSLGFRLGLVCAGLAALCVALVADMLRREGVSPIIIVAGCVWLCGSTTVLRNARVVEIYGFGALCTLLALWGLHRGLHHPPGGTERNFCIWLALGAAVLAVWGFGDARSTLALPVIGLWIWGAHSRRVWALWSPVVVVAVSTSCLTLALASARMPMADWGDPDGWYRLWQHLDARSIRASFADQMWPATWAQWLRNMNGAFDRLVEDSGLGFVLLVVAIAKNYRHGPEATPARRVLRVACAVILIGQALYIVAINPMGGADRQTGFVAHCVLVLWTCLELGWAPSRPGAPRVRDWSLAGVIAVTGALPAHIVAHGDGRQTRSWQPHAWTRVALSRAAPSALVLTQSDDLAAGCLAARALEGARPDLVCVPGQHLYRRAPDRARPHPRELAIWTAAAGRGSDAARVRAALSAWTGPVLLEYPGSGLFAGLWPEDGAFRAWSPRPVGEFQVGPAEREDMSWLLGTCRGREDRLRIARAVGARIRARLGAMASAEPRAGQRAAAVMVAESEAKWILTEVYPDHLPTMVNSAILLGARGQRDAARLLLRRALELDPWREAALDRLAGLLEQDGSPGARAEALALVERLLALEPDHSGALARRARLCHRSESSAGEVCE